METNRLASCWDVWRKGMGRSHGPLGATFWAVQNYRYLCTMPRATCSRRNGQRCTCYRRLNAPDLWALQIDEQLTTGGHSRQTFIVTQTGQNEQASQHRNIAPVNDFEPGKVARMETVLTCTTLRFGRTQRETAQTSSKSFSGPCLRAAPIQRGGGVGGKIDGSQAAKEKDQAGIVNLVREFRVD
ncbi:hypothetical protein DFH06DRAFT_1305067 [Mycena polygramma]|nr:hypothetical protein DFH06DRAFT_1305067 [Mycena polygramma]